MTLKILHKTLKICQVTQMTFHKKEPLELKAFKRILDKGNKLNKVGFAAQSLSQTDYKELFYGV